MEHNKLDDIFRKQILENDAPLNDRELSSKNTIWGGIEMPSQRKIFPIWKVAAAILLLLLGGTSWFFSKKINQEKEQYLILKNNYNNINTSLEKTTIRLEEAIKMMEEIQVNNIPKANQITKANFSKNEIVEKVVYLHDTIWIEPKVAVQEKIQLVRDTIFVEIPTTQSSKLVEVEKVESPTEEKLSQPRQPNKVEFVFGKKPLKQPASTNKNILIKQTEIVKKTKPSKNRLIPIPFNN